MRASANDPAGSLRTLDLRPRVLEASYADAVWSVCRFRESMLAGASGEGEDGRLLVYFPDAELSDGAAEKASKGFFDVYNIFNSNANQAMTTSSGASWLRPTAITPPRIARLGIKFRF